MDKEKILKPEHFFLNDVYHSSSSLYDCDWFSDCLYHEQLCEFSSKIFRMYIIQTIQMYFERKGITSSFWIQPPISETGIILNIPASSVDSAFSKLTSSTRERYIRESEALNEKEAHIPVNNSPDLYSLNREILEARLPKFLNSRLPKWQACLAEHLQIITESELVFRYKSKIEITHLSSVYICKVITD